ncbi:MAG: iron complex outermembrane receptor protein, partial [Lentisphaeria bacterium]
MREVLKTRKPPKAQKKLGSYAPKLTFAWLLFSYSLICMASDTENTLKETDTEEVIVTSQMREETLVSVPISIAVIDEALIKNAAAINLSDLEFASPSINFGRGGRNTRGEIAIRGIGDFSRNIGNDARVVVYVDGVPMVRSS